MYNDDYQITFAQEQNLRNPKNRFLGLFCHANEVDNSWGCKCPFWVGIVLLSIIVGSSALSDIPSIRTITHVLYWINFFTGMIILRIISDFCAIIGIIFAICSIIKSNYNNSVVAYYCLTATFVINTIFSIYIMLILFFYSYYRYIHLRFIPWFIDEFILVLFCWFLFCNMVVIGRRNRQIAASNTFI